MESLGTDVWLLILYYGGASIISQIARTCKTFNVAESLHKVNFQELTKNPTLWKRLYIKEHPTPTSANFDYFTSFRDKYGILDTVVYYSLLELKRRYLGKTKPVFVNPSSVTRCYSCSTKFDLFTWKHHCATCGKVFCKSCIPVSVPLPALGHKKDQPICRKCEKILSKRCRLYSICLINKSKKTVLLGQESSGKSCLVQQLVSGTFNAKNESTIG